MHIISFVIQVTKTLVAKLIAGPNLEYQGSIRYLPKRALFLRKRALKNSPPPSSSPFLSVLHQNQGLYNFYIRGQGPKAGRCFCLD